MSKYCPAGKIECENHETIGIFDLCNAHEVQTIIEVCHNKCLWPELKRLIGKTDCEQQIAEGKLLEQKFADKVKASRQQPVKADFQQQITELMSEAVKLEVDAKLQQAFNLGIDAAIAAVEKLVVGGGREVIIAAISALKKGG
jgi:hypothetical protein